jgi:hypothetical protein
MNFQVLPVKSDEITRIKVERFGSLLESFKAQYEAPIVESFRKVKALKKSISARKSRKLIGRAATPKSRERRAHADKEGKFEQRERKMEKTIHSFLKRDSGKRELLYGRTKAERTRREAIVSRLMHGHFWEQQSPDAEYNADNPPPEVAANPLSNWKWEKTLDDMSLAEVVAKELERDGIEVTWDNITRESREHQDRISDQDEVSQMVRSHAFGRAMVKPSELVEDRPAILKPPRHPPPSKPKKEKIVKVNDENPIAFESVHYPLNTDLYSPYRTRKVSMYVKVGALNLPEAVRSRFLALTLYPESQRKVVKPRYNPGLDLLKLTSRSQRTLRGNRAAVVRLFRHLLNEAWKADLNYIPIPSESERENLAPHQKIHIEEQIAREKEKSARQQSFDSVKARALNGLTVFRLSEIGVTALERQNSAGELRDVVRRADI